MNIVAAIPLLFKTNTFAICRKHFHVDLDIHNFLAKKNLKEIQKNDYKNSTVIMFCLELKCFIARETVFSPKFDLFLIYLIKRYT